MGNEGCPSYGWSIVSSASANSALAAVLAGFVFSGITILFGRVGARGANAWALFISAFVVLAFDSYMFAMVSGSDQSDQCVRVWSEGMAASGLLAVGGAAVMTGIGWLVHNHADSSQPSDAALSAGANGFDVAQLARVMARGVVIAVALLLTRATRDYYNIAIPGIAGWVEWMTLAVPLIIGGLVVWLAVWPRVQPHRSGSTASATTTPPPPASHAGSFRYACYAVLAYGLIAPIFAGTLSYVPPSMMTPGDSTAVVVATTGIGLVIPGVLLVLLVLAAAPPATVRQRRFRINAELQNPAENSVSEPASGTGSDGQQEITPP